MRATFDEIIQKALDSGFDAAEVATFCAEYAMTREEFADTVSRTVATRYHSREADFAFCDGVMNCLYGFITRRGDSPMPPYSQSIFLAFDEGEYYHDGDPPGSDPEDLYTRPAVANILSSNAQVT